MHGMQQALCKHRAKSARGGDAWCMTTRMWVQDTLFDPLTYKCQSRANNQIAFKFDVALLQRVLKAAIANAADSTEMKLAMRTPPPGGDAAPVAKPTLSFTSLGHKLNLTQELPISKPYTSSREYA